MKRILAILVTTLFCFGLFTPLLAQEKGTISPIIAVAKEAKMRTKQMQTVTIFLNGNDSLVTRVAEDALSIHLTNAGLTVVNRETLERTVGEQVVKKKKEKAEGAISALEVGQAVNADSVLTGTLFVEPGEQRSFSVRVASFQIMDVASGKTLLSILFEPEKGKSLSEITKAAVDILRQNLK